MVGGGRLQCSATGNLPPGSCTTQCLPLSSNLQHGVIVHHPGPYPDPTAANRNGVGGISRTSISSSPFASSLLHPLLPALISLSHCFACSGHHLVNFGLSHLTNCRLSWLWCKRAYILHQKTPKAFALWTSRPVGEEPSSWHSISNKH